MSDGPYIVKYRPKDLGGMKGQEEALRSLQKAFDRGDTRPHTFLLTGPSGVGKTTTARIIAGWLKADVFEIDAASNSGVEEMRQLVELANYMPMSNNPYRMIIVDECHTLSRQAWQPLLKLTEEPPDHLFFALCTTDADKVPITIKTRAFPVTLNRVPRNDLFDLVAEVIDSEKLDVADEVLVEIVQMADGSPRMLLNYLHAVNGAKTAEEVQRTLNLVSEDHFAQFCRKLMAGTVKWEDIKAILNEVDEKDYDKAFASMARWAAVAMSKAKTEDEGILAWRVLDALTFPSSSWDKRASFCAAIGRAAWVAHGKA